MNKNIITTTPIGKEGFNISYSTEQICGEKLLKILPEGWKVSFSWMQILFSDVQYEIKDNEKIIDITYNKNLAHWWNKIVSDIKYKIIELERGIKLKNNNK
ncbi:MAG: hypothetical protein ACFFDN_06880 [Candidatus Hodarchaeota archaeon]